MKIYDISQELFHCCVFPGDSAPSGKWAQRIADGDSCNLTELSLCAHNGTHVDAPFHFYEEGKTVDQLELYKMIGEAAVVSFDGKLREADIDRIMETAPKRILFKGNAVVTLEAARALNRHNVQLIGVESQTVGPPDAPEMVHLELLKNEVVLLEGIRLKDAPEGIYFLNAAPINLGGADGAPCRAMLIAWEEQEMKNGN